jgi:hypothetical protein
MPQAIYIAGLATIPAAGIHPRHTIPAATDQAGLLRATFKASFRAALPPSAPTTSFAASLAPAGDIIKVAEKILKAT